MLRDLTKVLCIGLPSSSEHRFGACLAMALFAVSIISASQINKQTAFADTEDEDVMFKLFVTTEPKNLLRIDGADEYEIGTYAETGKAPENWMGHKFVGWKIDGIMYPENPARVLMDKDHTVTAVYTKKKSIITIDSHPRVSSVIVDGTIYFPTDLPLTFEWDDATEHTIKFEDKVEPSSFVRHLFTGWNDLETSLERTIIVEGDKSLKALYETQYYVLVLSPYGKTTGSGWHEEGQIADIGVSQYVESDDKARRSFVGWHNDVGLNSQSAENKVIVSGPVVAKALWEEQYHLDVKSGLDAISVGGSGWFKKDTVVPVIAPSEFEDRENGIKYFFDGWSVIGAKTSVMENQRSPITSIKLDSSYALVAKWKKSFRLGIDDPFTKLTGAGYYEDGKSVTIPLTVNEVMVQEGKSKFVLGSITVLSMDGQAARELTTADGKITLLMDGPKTIQTDWKKQYYLDVSSNYGITSGSGWYDEGQTATFSINQLRNPGGFWNQYKFSNWQGETYSGDAQSVSVVMTGPMSVKATWEEDVAGEALSITAIMGVAIVGAILYLKMQKHKKQHATQAASQAVSLDQSNENQGSLKGIAKAIRKLSASLDQSNENQGSLKGIAKAIRKLSATAGGVLRD